MTIAAFATHCTRGYLYLRGEYPDALATLEEFQAELWSTSFDARRLALQ